MKETLTDYARIGIALGKAWKEAIKFAVEAEVRTPLYLHIE